MKALILAVVMSVCAVESSGCGERFRFADVLPGQKEFGLVVGHGGNHQIPAATKDVFSFDVVKARCGWFTSRRTELGIDVGYERANTSKRQRLATAAVFLRRYVLVRGSTALAFCASVGYAHFYESVNSLGTKDNFIESLGLTFQHALGPRTALTVEYRFSHISNAGMKLPNIGINSSALAAGVSWYPRR